MKSSSLIVLTVIGVLLGAFVGSVGLQRFLPDADFQRGALNEIEIDLTEKQTEIPLTPLFARESDRELCIFTDAESSDPDSGEYQFKKHFEGRAVDVGYENGEDYAMIVTLSSDKEVRVYPFRNSHLRSGGHDYFFKGVKLDGRLQDWGCVDAKKAVLLSQPIKRTQNATYLYLSEVN